MVDFVRQLVHFNTFTFTRPNDTNVYIAGDVMNASSSAGAVFEFQRTSIADNSGAIIQGVNVTCSVIPGGAKPDMELYLFDTAPAAVNDNAAFAPSDAEVLALQGIIVLPVASWKVGTVNMFMDINNLGLPVAPKTGGSMYGVLVHRAGYTPTAQEVYSIRLKVLD